MSYKTCKNGHHYQVTLPACPYCPHSNYVSETLGSATVPQAGSEKTRVFSHPQGTGSTGSSDKTQVYIPAEKAGGPVAENPAALHSRKLVGWLVTYSARETGQDFRLFEGKNVIGSDPACDLVLSEDTAVSAKHLTILYRLGEFLFKDEFSTNGTFVNEVLQNEGQLQDGDEIRVGKTVLLFRKSFK